MLRNVCVLMVLVGIILGAGFGVNSAQSDIFVRQTPKSDTGAVSTQDAEPKKRIFLNPFASKAKKQVQKDILTKNVTVPLNVPKINTAALMQKGTTLDIQAAQKYAKEGAKAVAIWQQIKEKPNSREGMLSYVTAFRAADVGAVKEMQARLDGASKTLFAKHEAAFETRISEQVLAAFPYNAVVLVDGGRFVGRSNSVAQGGAATQTTKRVYRRDNATSEQVRKPARVFTNFR